MKKIMLVMAVLLLASTGCGRRIGTDTELEGEISRNDEEISGRLEDAEELLAAAGRPVDSGSPCATFGLAAGKNLLIEVASDDFDPVIAAFDRDGSILGVSDDWDDSFDSHLVLADVPRGARLIVFALDGSGGEFELRSEEADQADIDEFAAYADIVSGTIKGDIIDDKDDELMEDILEEELDAYLYEAGYGSARLHPFEVTEEQLVSLVLESDEFDTILALVEIDGDEYDYVTHNDDYSGSLSSRVDQVLEPGRYAAVVIPYYSGLEGSYTLSCETYDLGAMEPVIVDAGEPGAEAAGTVTAGTGLAITVWPGISVEKPYDLLITAATPCAFFRFEIGREEAGLYDIYASSTDLDAYLCLLSVDGETVWYIASNDDYRGSDSGLTEMLPPGEYLALVTSYSGTSEGEVGFGYSPSVNEPLPLQEDRVVEADVSWTAPELYYSLEIMAGSVYLVSARSDEIDPFIEAVLPDGTILSDDDGGGYPNAQLRLDPTPAQSGTALITVRDYAGGSTGAIRVEVTRERRSQSEVFALYD